MIDSYGNEVGAGTDGLLLRNGGTVCDDYFDSNSAKAICRKMGYDGYTSYDSGYIWSIQTSLQIKLDDVQCSSGEWNSCSYLTSNNCGHHEDVFLQCFAALTATGKRFKFHRS